MTLTFITNYMTPHQKPLCDELYKQLGDDFHFIAVEKMDEERVKMGWGEDMDDAPYAFLMMTIMTVATVSCARAMWSYAAAYISFI